MELLVLTPSNPAVQILIFAARTSWVAPALAKISVGMGITFATLVLLNPTNPAVQILIFAARPWVSPTLAKISVGMGMTCAVLVLIARIKL